MSKVSFEVSDEERDLMRGHPEINWSAEFRRTIQRRVKAQEIAQALLDEDDDPRIQAVAKQVKDGVARRFDAAVARRS